MAHETRQRAELAQRIESDPTLTDTAPCFTCGTETPKYALRTDISDDALCPQCWQIEIDNDHIAYVYAVRDEHSYLADFVGSKNPDIIDGVPHCSICEDHVELAALECSNGHPITCQICDTAQSNFCPNCGARLRTHMDDRTSEEIAEWRCTEDYRREVLGWND